jgi:hypothetical protein
VNAFLVWLAYSPLNVFAWVVYVARIVYLVFVAWLERSEVLTPSLPHHASAIRSRMKKILRAIRA